MEKIDKNGTPYDSGVMAIFNQERSTIDNTDIRLDYYGLIQDILEVNYRRFYMFILDLKWFKVVKTGRGATVHRDQSGFYAIDSKVVWINKDDMYNPHTILGKSVLPF